MDKQTVTALCLSAFGLGALSVARVANRKIVKMHKENTILQMKINALLTFAEGVYEESAVPIAVNNKLADESAFINLIDGF